MSTSILGIGKAVPEYTYQQKDLGESTIKHLGLEDKTATLLRKVYENSQIATRHSVIHNLLEKENIFSTRALKNEKILMSERNQFYKNTAPKLALEAAKEAINAWKGEISQITHLITVTCTGLIAPGLEILLSKELGMCPYASLFGVNLSGCHGSFKALHLADRICKENPNHRVLIVSVELCSLHFKPNTDLQTLVIQSLFSDGSAAVVLGGSIKANENPLYELQKGCMALIDKTLEAITWDASDEGFDMTLSLRVPSILRKNLHTFIERLSLPNKEEVEWAIHPGGKEIIEAVEQSLQVKKEQTQSSWNTLKSFGNMSSATILFVLADIATRHIDRKHVACLGFGPGITAEFYHLKKF